MQVTVLFQGLTIKIIKESVSICLEHAILGIASTRLEARYVGGKSSNWNWKAEVQGHLPLFIGYITLDITHNLLKLTFCIHKSRIVIIPTSQIL